MQKKTIFKWLLTTEIVASVAVVVVIVAVPTAVIYSNKSTNETTEVASPIDNSANKYTVDSSTNQMSFAGYYNDTTSDGVGSSTDMNAIVKIITPDVTDITTDNDTTSGGTGVWSAGVENSDKTTTTYTLETDGTSDSAYQYIENFISITDWYNKTSASTLNVQLATSDLDYDALSGWNVSLVLNVYSDSSYEFVYSINPKSDDSDTSSSTTDSSYQFILYTKYAFATTFTNGNRGEAAPAVPVDNFLNQYTVDSDTMTFAGYYGDTNASNTEMNEIVNTITPNIALSDTSTWTSSSETTSSGTAYTSYKLTIDSDLTYIKNFISVTDWYNETSTSTLNAQLATDDLDYDVLTNYDFSLVLNVYSDSSYEFVYSINPKSDDSDTSSSTTTTDFNYQFILYTKYTFGTTFTNGNRGEAAATVPVDNFLDKYYVGDVDNENYHQMKFAAYYTTAQDQSTVTANMQTIVSAISPGVSDVTNDTTGTWTSASQTDGSVIYTLTKYNDGSSGSDAYQYIKNFMNLSSNYGGWKNIDSTRNVSTVQLSESDLNYDSLSNYDISLELIYYGASSYKFVYVIAAKDSSDTVSDYVFTLYTYYTYNNNANKF